MFSRPESNNSRHVIPAKAGIQYSVCVVPGIADATQSTSRILDSRLRGNDTERVDGAVNCKWMSP